eukprot:scaffold1386_cov342-Pavlova_lutheri.AAC.4
MGEEEGPDHSHPPRLLHSPSTRRTHEPQSMGAFLRAQSTHQGQLYLFLTRVGTRVDSSHGSIRFAIDVGRDARRRERIAACSEQLRLHRSQLRGEEERAAPGRIHGTARRHVRRGDASVVMADTGVARVAWNNAQDHLQARADPSDCEWNAQEVVGTRTSWNHSGGWEC